MRKALLTSVLTLAAGAGLARADDAGKDKAPPKPPQSQAAPDLQPLPASGFADWAATPADGDGHWGRGDGERFADAGRVYGGAEYLLWWMKGYNAPPLVTTGPPITNGFLGAPGVTTLFPEHRLTTQDPFSGGRFTLGLWLDDCHTCGVEGSFFFLGHRSEDFNVGSAAFPLLARPFVLPSGGPFTEITASPGIPLAGGGFSPLYATGGISVNSESRLLGSELNLRTNLCHDCGYYLDALAGFRYLDLEESLSINEAVNFGPDTAFFGPGFGALASNQFLISDRFATRNQFYGGQVGLAGEYRLGERLSVGGFAKVALGTTHEVVEISGSTQRIFPSGVVERDRGGLLAEPSNIGRFTKNPFAVVPEALLSVGYYVTPGIRLSVGYDFLYWSNVVRPGDQIDRVIDPAQIPSFRGFGFTPSTPERPVPLLKQTDFWAQGLCLGVEFRW